MIERESGALGTFERVAIETRWLIFIACAGCGARTELAGMVLEDASNDVTITDANTDVSTCPHVDAGAFACGDAAACNSTSEYCHETAGGPPPGVDILKCMPLPNGCSTCDGLQTKTCFCKDDSGHILVTCPVP